MIFNLKEIFIILKNNSICKIGLLLAVLLIQNLVYFYPHWFNGYSFPGDFEKTYHAIPYYLIEAYHAGAGLDWIPFAGMGYPTVLNLQSGIFYPPFWVIALLGLSYTIKTAVLLQCLTVLFGALGFSILGRAIGLSWTAALFAGFCYQGFGGFYLNAMHPDIVRGFALAPWLCLSSFARWGNPLNRSLKLYLCALPLFVYLLWTGSYPGVTIATLFILTLHTLSRGVFSVNKIIPLLIILGISIGTLLAFPAILPALLMKSDIGRSTLEDVHHDYATWNDIFALIYNTRNSFFKHDPTMNSLYVGVPVLALIAVGIKPIIKHSVGPWLLVLAVFAIIFASGLFANVISVIAPQLQYSRFIYSDYKVFIAIPILLGAAISFDQKRCWITSNLFILFYLISIGNILVLKNDVNTLRDIVYLTTILFVVIFLIINEKIFSNKAFASVLLLLVVLDWCRTHWNDTHHSGYAFKDGIHIFESGMRFEQPGISFTDQKENLRSKLYGPLKQRPQRIDITEKNYCWKGYYSGDYLMRDWSGPMQFSRQKSILSSQELMDFAKQEWMALFIPFGQNFIGDWRKNVRCQVFPIKYGTDFVEYEITIPENGIFITNELFFLGWTAEFKNVNNSQIDKSTPFSVQGFRAFKVSKGSYLVRESYKTPFSEYTVPAIFLAIFLFLLYALFIINNFALGTYVWRKTRKL